MFAGLSDFDVGFINSIRRAAHLQMRTDARAFQVEADGFTLRFFGLAERLRVWSCRRVGAYDTRSVGCSCACGRLWSVALLRRNEGIASFTKLILKSSSSAATI
jgi:hypothetical protein